MFNVTPEYALHELSYMNIIMYSHAMPTLGDIPDDNDLPFDEALDADNPDNFNNITEMTV